MKKILSLLLMSAMTAALFFTNTFAATADPVPRPQIGSVSGTVTEISDFYNQDNKIVANTKFVLVTDRNGGISCFVMDADTYFITGKGLSDLRVGDIFTGFYDATIPMNYIYPPRYQPIAVAVNPPVDMYSIKVDKFDNDLISSDNQLKLTLSEETKILTKDGASYNGELPGLTLAVIYHVSTKSLPAQTTPSKIIVLEDYNEQFAYMFDDIEHFALISWDYGDGHSGINITSYYNHPIYQAPIKSVCNGTVVYVIDEHKTAGNYVVIETDDGIKVSYMMMDEPTTLKVGDTVEKGKTIIGYVGKSGNATGSNLLISFFKTKPGDKDEFWARPHNSMDPKKFFPDIDFILLK